MPTLLTAKNFNLQPWKNGGGLTQELYRIPHASDPEKFLFRLSIASVNSSGPFSGFEGIDRTLILLSGNGMKLNFEDGRTEILEKPFQKILFRGEDKIDCSLIKEEIRDFNVMTDRETLNSRVEIIRIPADQTLDIRESHPLFIYHYEGEALSGEQVIQPDSLWIFSPDERTVITSKTSCCFIKVHLISK